MDPTTAKKLYDDWGDRYTASVEAWGYDMPQKIAAHLAALALSSAEPSDRTDRLTLLDAGAGDGLSGLELRKAGFGVDVAELVGVDLSPKLLAIAMSRGCYDRTKEVDLSTPLPFESGIFDHISCVGTLTYLSPKCGVLEEFLRVTKKGGYICFNLRTDHEWSWLPVQNELARQGRWRLVERSSPQPYLPNNPQYGTKVLTVIFTFQKAP